MRLLNSTSLEMREFLGDNIPPYAILSHTWRKEEVTFQDMEKSEKQNMAGYSKILSCCEQAKLDGIEWVWIDTCCIDKTSSAELSEAINSMFAWYEDSEVCYALLDDVASFESFLSGDEFSRARWFERGWCLQELIAPSKIEFYSANWTDIGTKQSLYSKIEKITSIPAEVLLRKSNLADYTVAQKMSWASNRRTTRQEDRAYSLLGIFGVSMPLLYGEGIRSFHRLQEEIMRQTEDLSILLWTDHFQSTSEGSYGVLASYPSSFSRSGPYASTGTFCNYQSIEFAFLNRQIALKALPHGSTHMNPPQMTTRGLHLHTFVQEDSLQNRNSLLLWTGCMYKQDYICIKLHPNKRRGHLKYERYINHYILLVDADDFKSFKLTDLYLNTDIRRHARIHGGIIRPPETLDYETEKNLGSDIEIILSTKCEESLFFVKAFPSIEICCTDNFTQSQRLWCWSSPFCYQLSLHLKSYKYASKNTPEQFIVNLGLKKTSPRCSITVNSAVNTSLADNAPIQDDFDEVSDTRMGDLLEEERETRISDRATAKLLNGRMVYVVAKGSTQPDVGRNHFKQRKPAMYTLYVTLFA